MTNFIKNFLKKHGYSLLLLSPPIVFIFFYFPTSLAYHAEKINSGLNQLSLASWEIKKDVSDCRNNILLDNSQTQIYIDTLN